MLHEAKVDNVIQPFLWSGANSVFARDQAAIRLAENLKTSLDQFPDAVPIVIAHSHGGNVALRASSYLGEAARAMRIITLATPFLRVFPAKTVNPKLHYWLAMSIFIIMFGLVFLVFQKRQNHDTIEIVILIALFGATSALSFFVARLWFRFVLNMYPDDIYMT
jgi:RsiW-degrading membrane proteinase PrsW (M82 family)